MLGVKRYHVTLVQHNEDWINQYQISKNELLSVLGDNIINIYHVGSTAIKGILAKPILDIAVEIESVEKLNIIGMQSIGYDWCGDHDDPNRYLFVKRKHGDISTHHIHCYPKGSESLKATILFCEYLNHHAEYANYYNDLKKELAVKYPNDRSAYTAAKSDFINNIISLAREGQCAK